MYTVLTDIGIISQYQDTGLETIEEAEAIAEAYAAQGHVVEIRDEETGDSVKLYNADKE